MDFLIGLTVSVLTQLLKRFGFEKWSTHIAVFGLALVGSVVKYGFGQLPGVYWESLLGIWSSAVLLYEVILKRIEPFEKLGGV